MQVPANALGIALEEGPTCWFPAWYLNSKLLFFKFNFERQKKARQGASCTGSLPKGQPQLVLGQMEARNQSLHLGPQVGDKNPTTRAISYCKTEMSRNLELGEAGCVSPKQSG